MYIHIFIHHKQCIFVLHYYIGMGTTSNNGDESNVLRHVELGFVPIETCNDVFGNILTSSIMCAADPGEDACQGKIDEISLHKTMLETVECTQ